MWLRIILSTLHLLRIKRKAFLMTNLWILIYSQNYHYDDVSTQKYFSHLLFTKPSLIRVITKYAIGHPLYVINIINVNYNIYGSEEPNRSRFESNTKHKLKLIKYSNEYKSLISR